MSAADDKIAAGILRKLDEKLIASTGWDSARYMTALGIVFTDAEIAYLAAVAAGVETDREAQNDAR